MIGIFFLILSLTALKIALWQAGIFSGFFSPVKTSDFTIAGLSFIAAIVFFGLWAASRIHNKERQ